MPGTLVFVAVMLGSTSFDGFSRTTIWQNLLGDVRANVADESQWVVDLATTFVSVVGLSLFVGVVILTYLVAVSSARLLVHTPRSLVPDFVLPLVPIAFAYLVAHYFSLFVIQGQFIFTLISDPFGRGRDLFGTVDFAPNLSRRKPSGGCRSRSSWWGMWRGSPSPTTGRSRSSRADATLYARSTRCSG
ncbi:MAG: hypothetical protein H0U30_01110 [Actinobacteria bacterium]|nr:hypothetical protein [Actinomycetota bacterium]